MTTPDEEYQWRLYLEGDPEEIPADEENAINALMQDEMDRAEDDLAETVRQLDLEDAGENDEGGATEEDYRYGYIGVYLDELTGEGWVADTEEVFGSYHDPVTTVEYETWMPGARQAALETARKILKRRARNGTGWCIEDVVDQIEEQLTQEYRPRTRDQHVSSKIRRQRPKQRQSA